MSKYLWMIPTLLLVGCAAQLYRAQATQSRDPNNPNMIIVVSPQVHPVASPTPLRTATPDPYLQIHGSQTAVGLQQQMLNQQAQQVALDQSKLDMQIKSDAATAVAHGIATQTRIAEIGMTQRATEGVPGTQIAGTSTSAALTQIADVERQQHNAQVFSIWVWRFFLAGLGAVIIFFAGGRVWIHLKTTYFRLSQIQPDDKGRLPVVPEDAIPGKNKTLINPNLAHRVSTANDDLTADQALANVSTHRQLEAVRAIADSPAARQLINKAKPDTESLNGMPTANVNISAPAYMPELTQRQAVQLPEWSRLAKSWDGKMLPYGQSDKGLLLADPAQEPHWLIVGRTRSGKSRYGTRTIAAAALTMGYQVLFIGKRVDFFPFEDHPNAKIIGVDLFNEPRKYFEILQRIAKLMKERDEYLTSHRKTTWQQTGLPQLYVVMDEFSSAVKQLNGVKAGLGNLVSTMATALIQEGGKYGLNIVQVVQDATGTNVDVTARRNMGRMVFRLSEQRSSDIALGVNGEPSAVGLPPRHFLSVVGEVSGVIHGVAFAPSDDEISAFLKERPVQAHEPIDFIEAEARDVDEPTDQAVTQTKPEVVSDIDTQIMDLYLEQLEKGKVSLSAIQRAVYKRQIPNEFYHIQQLVADYQKAKNTTTTTTTTGKLPNSEPLAA